MKKIIITLVAACALAFSANAQFYAGGGIGLNLMAGSGSSQTAWKLSPEVGYSFNEKSSLGLYLDLAGSGDLFQFAVNPYYRFTFAQVGNISFFGEGTLQLAWNKIKGFDGSSSNWGIYVVPGLAYSVSDKFDIVARLGRVGVAAGSGTTFVVDLLMNSSFGVAFKF